MPDFNRIKYHKDGRITISGFPGITVANWTKNEKSGWDIDPVSPDHRGFNALPRSSGDTTIIRWAKNLGAWRDIENGPAGEVG